MMAGPRRSSGDGGLLARTESFIRRGASVSSRGSRGVSPAGSRGSPAATWGHDLFPSALGATASFGGKVDGDPFSEAVRIVAHHQEECQNYFSDWQDDLKRLRREHLALCDSLAKQLRRASLPPEPSCRPTVSEAELLLTTEKPLRAPTPFAPPGTPPVFTAPRPASSPAPAWPDHPNVPGGDQKDGNTATTTATSATTLSTEVMVPASTAPAPKPKAVPPSRFGDPIAFLYGVERSTNNALVKKAQPSSGAPSGGLRSRTISLSNIRRTPAELEGTKLQRFVRSLEVRSVCSLAILANAVFMGVHAQEQLQSLIRTGAELHQNWENIETGFCCFFMAELLLRYIAERKGFWHSEDTPWNIFDTFLVALSTIDILLTSFAKTSGLNFTFARTMRIFRFARILRIVRVMRFFYSFRLMVYSVIYSIVSLLWVFVMLLFVMYFFAIFFLHGVAEYFKDPERIADAVLVGKLGLHFGTVPNALQSLFMGISGGIDWHDLKAPLSQVSAVYGWIFLFYIFFMVFGVLNVVMASFVDSASQISRKDRELVTQNEMERQKQYAANIRGFFHEADVDSTGTLSWEEFESYLQNDKVQAYFQSFELDVSQARTLFKLLDLDESNDVGIDEFVEGCMRMKGPARSIDVNMLLYESEKMMDRQVDFMAYVEEQFEAMEHIPSHKNSENKKRMTRIRDWAKERVADKILSGRASRATGAFQSFFEDDPVSRRSTYPECEAVASTGNLRVVAASPHHHHHAAGAAQPVQSLGCMEIDV